MVTTVAQSGFIINSRIHEMHELMNYYNNKLFFLQSLIEMTSKKSVKTILKESFVDVCSNTTAHAIPNIFRSDNIIIKIYWLLLLLLATGCSIYCKSS